MSPACLAAATCPAADFINCFPISPRQPSKKKAFKSVLHHHSTINTLEKQNKNSRSQIDRSKPRKSPERPLPDIVAKLAQSSSDSDGDFEDNTTVIKYDKTMIKHDLEIDFRSQLKDYENITQKHVDKRLTSKVKKRQKSYKC